MGKKLIISKFEINGCLSVVTVLKAQDKIVEITAHKATDSGILGNIYIGRVQKVVENLQAAFIDIAPHQSCYYSLENNSNPHFTSVKKDKKIKAGDELLVQVNTEAMKSKVPSVTSNLNLAGKYLVLTTGEKKLGFSSKLSIAEKKRLKEWVAPVLPENAGVIVRTNARDAAREELIKELKYLYKRLEKILMAGDSRVCYSLVEEADPEYIHRLRELNSGELEQIITDDRSIYDKIEGYLKEYQRADMNCLIYYEDPLLPLFKLHSIEPVLQGAMREKVWLKSGGFLMIQQTEALVAIDVNSGKYQGKKKPSETYRKINLEAAQEIAYQLRLRNLSGIILIDFINMQNKDHLEELFHLLNKYLKKDSVKAVAVDITGLQIMEVTRKKVRRSLNEQITEIKESKEERL